MHQPVLLQEVIMFLDPKPGDLVVDGTVDGGGHAEAIIRKIMPGGKFLGLDWDEGMLSGCRKRIGTHADIFLLHGNYADLPVILEKEKLGKADGFLLDLGFSSEQIADSGRGFSFEEAGAAEPLLHDLRRFAEAGAGDSSDSAGERGGGHHFRIRRRAFFEKNRTGDRGTRETETDDVCGRACGDGAGRSARRLRTREDRSGDADIPGIPDLREWRTQQS